MITIVQAQAAFEKAGLNYDSYVKINDALMRPTEVSRLLGNSAKAKRLLGWIPTVSFDALIQEMVEHDLASVEHSLSSSVAG